MKALSIVILLAIILFIPNHSQSQNTHNYKASLEQPFGKINPEAATELQDYAFLIGSCECLSTQRNPQGIFQDTVKTIWNFKYIFNGMAIQDETFKADGSTTSSIRQFNSDSAQWYVTFFSSGLANPTPKTWSGKTKEGNTMVLSAAQKAPNGMVGDSRLTFYEISKEGFRWKGEWISQDGTIVYPFWMIDCKKRKNL